MSESETLISMVNRMVESSSPRAQLYMQVSLANARAWQATPAAPCHPRGHLLPFCSCKLQHPCSAGTSRSGGPAPPSQALLNPSMSHSSPVNPCGPVSTRWGSSGPERSICVWALLCISVNRRWIWRSPAQGSATKKTSERGCSPCTWLLFSCLEMGQTAKAWGTLCCWVRLRVLMPYEEGRVCGPIPVQQGCASG